MPAVVASSGGGFLHRGVGRPVDVIVRGHASNMYEVRESPCGDWEGVGGYWSRNGPRLPPEFARLRDIGAIFIMTTHV